MVQFRSGVAFLAFVTMLFVAANGCAAETPPNILLILADDLGYGDPGCFNAKSKIKTPHLDALAK